MFLKTQKYNTNTEVNALTFQEFCHVSDELLLNDQLGPARVAIPILHPIRTHPIFTQKYFQTNLVSSFKKIVFTLLKFLQSTFLSLLPKIKIEDLDSSLHNVDVLFISHLISLEDWHSENDFYFAGLPNKFKSVVVLINHTKDRHYTYRIQENLGKKIKILLPNCLSFLEELTIYSQLIRETITLFIESFSYAGEKRRIAQIAALDCLSPQAAFALRSGKSISKVIKKFIPKIIICTFEGHAWERIVFYESIKMDVKLLRVGYIHASVFKDQYAVKRSLGKDFDPDIILTYGPSGLKLLRENSSLSSKPTGILGSNRILGVIEAGVRKFCLVTPEGIIEECILLFDFTLKCAIKCPDLIFLWRLHPVILAKNYSALIKLYFNAPKNIIFSSNSLEHDISLSKYILFRGSTAAIPAIANGVIPFYFEAGLGSDINPLTEISSSFTKVKNADEFNHAINKQTVNKDIMRYCKEFFSPINELEISKYL